MADEELPCPHRWLWKCEVCEPAHDDVHCILPEDHGGDCVTECEMRAAHFPWHYTEFGVVCACGLSMDSNEQCASMREAHR